MNRSNATFHETNASRYNQRNIRKLFRKWRRWLDRIYDDQLFDLLINQRLFMQLSDCTKPYAGEKRAAVLAEFLTQGYLTFAMNTIRRMVEKPPSKPGKRTCPNCGQEVPVKKGKRVRSISMIILLRDLHHNSDLLTLERFSSMYPKDVRKKIANTDFYKITRNKRAKKLCKSRIERDIKELENASERPRRYLNKVIAHTERDRRRIVKVTYKDIDTAIARLSNAFCRYSLLIKGCVHDPLVPLKDFDIVQDLQQVWPSRHRGQTGGCREN